MVYMPQTPESSLQCLFEGQKSIAFTQESKVEVLRVRITTWVAGDAQENKK